MTLSSSATVTVVIPTFNRRRELSRALASVRAQTRPPEEVIVVDDGSTDDTARSVAREHPHATLIRQQNRGVSAARNAGIAAAAGEWIALLDSDDEWRPQKLERQLDALAKAGSDAVVCHTDEVWIRDGRRVNPMKKHAKAGGWIFERCLPLCAISPSSVLIHRRVFQEVGHFDETLPVCEDYDLWLRVCSRYPVVFVDEPLVVKYGGHADQLSRRYWGMDRYRIRALEGILEAGELDGESRRAAVRALVEKIDVYVAGARKRGKKRDAEEYEEIRRRWARGAD